MTSGSQSSRVFLWIALGGGAFFVFVAVLFVLVFAAVRSDDHTQFGGFGDRIAVVDLDGVIMEPKATVALWNSNTTATTARSRPYAAHQFARRWRCGFRGNLSRSPACARRETQAHRRFHRDCGRERRVLRRLRDQQDLCERSEHRRQHRRNCRVVQLRRSDQVGQAEADHDESRANSKTPVRPHAT